MTDLLRKHIDGGYCIVFLDDIMIYSKNEEAHEKHVQAVLDSVRRDGFRLQSENCQFGRAEAPFLGFKVNGSGVSMTSEKIAAIADWPDPVTPKEMRSFVGLAGVYRRFVKNFAKTASPLTALLNVTPAEFNKVRNDPEQWKQVTNAIDVLKAAMLAHPALALPSKEGGQYLVRTDASDFAIGATLRQLQKETTGEWTDRIIAYFSRKLHDAETRYSTYDKELLGVKDAIEHWRFYLHGGDQFKVQTDHSALQHILKQPRLTSRQMRLLETLMEYDFEIEYLPGARNYIQDALSRRPDYKDPPLPRTVRPGASQPVAELSLESGDCTGELMHASVIQADGWMEDVRAAYPTDPYFGMVYRQLSGVAPDNGTPGEKKQRRDRARHYWINDEGLILHRSTDRLCIPKELQNKVLHEAHDSTVGGHFGIDRTASTVGRRFFWPRQYQTVKQYVKGCAACARAKSTNQKPYGLLQPLDVPSTRWQRVNIDFITKLPISNGNDTIITFVDGLTKRAIWTATTEKDLTAQRFAEIFIDVYFRLHGIPESIVSDRDVRFTSDFWQHLNEIWRTKLRMSTAFHPQTDGLAEKVNSIVERYLRTFAAGNERNWAKLLPLAEFAYNASKHKATEMAQFEADLGYVPRMPLDVIAATTSANSNSYGGAAARPGGKQAVSFATTMADILAQLRDKLAITQTAQAAEANKKRQPHNFQTGDRVMINTRNMPLSYGAAAPGTDEPGARLSRALQQRYVGPYTLGMQRGNGNAFEITDMPQHLRIHKTYNVSEFKRCTIDESRMQAAPPPIRVTKSGDAEYGLEAIHEWRVDDNGRAQFRVQWEGQLEEEWTWEPLTNLTRFGGKETVREYAATLSDESLNKLLPKNLRPADPSVTTSTPPRAAKIKGLPPAPTRRSARIAAKQD
jgi:hypothetical protein